MPEDLAQEFFGLKSFTVPPVIAVESGKAVVSKFQQSLSQGHSCLTEAISALQSHGEFCYGLCAGYAQKL